MRSRRGLGSTIAPTGTDPKRHTARSDGTARIDLTQLVPISSEVELEVEIEGILRNDAGESPVRMKNSAKTTMERR